MPVLSHRRSVCEKAVAALATGDRSALATLYDCMGRSLFSVAYAVTGNWHDAEDVLQETLLDACRTAPSYRPGTSACAWLLAIARHKALDCVRRTGVRRAETLDDDRAAEEPGFAAVEALDLLRALDEEEREVVSCACTPRCRIRSWRRCWASPSPPRRSATSARWKSCARCDRRQNREGRKLYEKP